MVRLSCCLIFLFLTVPSEGLAQTRPVALELVLAVDTSTSVDDQEFELQRRGLAEAFAHPDLISVIEGMGEIGIAVTLVEWAGTGEQKSIVDWMYVNSRESSLHLASLINNAPRMISGMTDIGSVIRYSVDAFDRNGFTGNRKVIDVSGDGTSNTDTTSMERDRAIGRGITINGLVIFNKEYDLGELAEIDLIQHYSNQVIGGNGAFLMTASNFHDFRYAILNKLIREILGTTTAELPRIIQ
ncbi:MAG: DUF1194 domain-containing protein [Rhizobiaceae bacterium]